MIIHRRKMHDVKQSASRERNAGQSMRFFIREVA